MDIDRQGAKTPGLKEPPAALDHAAREVVDAALEVHRSIGAGFGEHVYENALCVELALRGITFERQARIAVTYKGVCVGEGRVDVVVRDCLVVELKSVGALLPVHTAQLRAYLKATNRQLGLLINFDVAVLRSGIKRVILSR